MMKHKTFPAFMRHLRNFIGISVLVFFAMFLFSLMFIVFNEPTNVFQISLPISIHYLGVFISLMMMIMGLTYVRFMKKREQEAVPSNT